jgi:hypothetical protein
MAGAPAAAAEEEVTVGGVGEGEGGEGREDGEVSLSVMMTNTEIFHIGSSRNNI